MQVNIKAEVCAIIYKKPCETVSSTGNVSSAAKAIPMGIMGTRNIAPTIIFNAST